MSGESTSAPPPDFDWDMIDRRLESWNDPTPRESLFTLDDLREACVAAAEGHVSRRATSPTREERLKYRDEHDQASLTIALQAYANMQSTHFEFVEVIERNLIDEHGKGFLHFNFVVKERTGKLTIFFAELHPDLKDENGVYLCVPLEEKDFEMHHHIYDLHRKQKSAEGPKFSIKEDQAYCYGCIDRASALVHPNDGIYLGGHKHVGFPFMEFDSDDDDD